MDLAGEVCFRPNFWQTKERINYLIDEYLSTDKLCDCLEDLPKQFQDPQPRKRSTINWQDINPEQVIGIELDIFLSIINQQKEVKNYQLRVNPDQDLYKHGLHRVTTEYSAVCLYIWLMSHATGTTQQVLAELLQDEVNHLTKFWGMGMWLYPDGAEQLIKHLLSQINTILPVSYESSSKSSLKSTFQRMMSVLNWQSWSILSRGELIYTFVWTLKKMWHWSSQLTPEYLQSCCATPEFFEDNLECDWHKIILF